MAVGLLLLSQSRLVHQRDRLRDRKYIAQVSDVRFEHCSPPPRRIDVPRRQRWWAVVVSLPRNERGLVGAGIPLIGCNDGLLDSPVGFAAHGRELLWGHPLLESRPKTGPVLSESWWNRRAKRMSSKGISPYQFLENGGEIRAIA